MIASTLRLVVAQRLVRRLCQRCHKPRALTAGEARALDLSSREDAQVCDPVGCRYCGDRGYSGRLGLFEMIDIDEEWSRRIGRGADKAELTARMRELGVASLVSDAADKVRAGLTTVSEALTAVSAW